MGRWRRRNQPCTTITASLWTQAATYVAVAVRGTGDSESGQSGLLNLYYATNGQFFTNLDQTGGDLYLDVAWDNVGNLYALDAIHQCLARLFSTRQQRGNDRRRPDNSSLQRLDTAAVVESAAFRDRASISRSRARAMSPMSSNNRRM